MWLWDRNVTIWSRILFHIGNEMSLAHLPRNVNQPVPNKPNPLCCSRMPITHSLAALIWASPSPPANLNAFLPFHWHAWLVIPVWYVHSIFPYPHRITSSSCCSLLSYSKKFEGQRVKLTSWCPWARPSRRVQTVFRLARASEVVWSSGFTLKWNREAE